MIKQYLRKKAVIVNGVVNSYLRGGGQPYDDTVWWDHAFYTDGISDRQTIGARKHRVSAQYHYSSVEQKICRYFYNHTIQRKARLWGGKAPDTDMFGSARILDIGSGSGHWIDFYRSLGARELVGIDVSESSVRFLGEKYASDDGISIHHGKAATTLQALDGNFDLINAIGVMFHIVDDSEWTDTIHAMADKLTSDGLLVIGGHFGWLDGLNVQIDKTGQVNKRLRSLRHWKQALGNAGLSRTCLYRNYAYLWINDPLPENSVLIAEKGGA